ncbi:hypothetical protein ACFV3O_15220, partial [Streptomyces albidoflavus]
AGPPPPLDGLTQLVSVELWQRRLATRRGSCWTGPSPRRQRAGPAGIAPAPAGALGAAGRG